MYCLLQVGDSLLQLTSESSEPKPDGIEANSVLPSPLPSGDTLNWLQDGDTAGTTTWLDGGNSSTSPRLSGTVCPECGLWCAFKSQLVKHMYIHTGEKPYSCPHCTYKARQRGTLNKHIKCLHPELFNQ